MMKHKELIAIGIMCVLAAGVMIFVIERMMRAPECTPVRTTSSPAAKPAVSSDYRDDEAMETIKEYEINAKTGEKQYLR